MEIEILEESAWRAAGRPLPSAVARSVTALRREYLGSDPQGGGQAPKKGAGLLARLAFFGVADAGKVGVVMGELAAAGALPSSSRWRVLDLGAGPGMTSLALAEWLRQSEVARAKSVALDLTLVDHDETSAPQAKGLFAAWRARAAEAGVAVPDVSLKVLVRDLQRAGLPDGAFDLVFCSNVLNELHAPDGGDSLAPRLELARAVLTRALLPSGTLIILEPALREPARVLHRLRDALSAEATIFAPCVRKGSCPMLASERDWCHEERPADLPERTRLIARLAGVRRESLKFAFLTVRRDGRRLHDAFPAAQYRVVSALLGAKGRDELFVCGDTGRLRVLRNRRDRSASNEPFDALGRGSLASFAPPLDVQRPRVLCESSVHAWDPLASASADQAGSGEA